MIHRALPFGVRLSLRRTSIGTVRSALIVLLLLNVIGIPSANAATSSRQATGLSTYSVGLERCAFVDHTRSVLNYSTNPPSLLSSSRALITEIRYPAASLSSSAVATPGALPASRTGGFPMIVFVHGYDVNPSIYAPMLDMWASNGFVVVAPTFPDESGTEVTRQHGANTEADLVNEPADVTFVTHQILNDSATATSNCSFLYGLIDSAALALAGHSDGAIAAGVLSYSTGLDPQGIAYSTLRSGLHFRATIIMEGDEGGRAPYRSSSTGPELLVIQSAQDHCNPAHGALLLYRHVKQSDKWFYELMKAHHLPPFDGVDRTAFNSVVTTTTAFFKMSLDETITQEQLVTVGNAQPNTARIFHAGPGPNIAPLTARYCGRT